jgi:RNA polymerase-binding transcription factor DksA
VTVEVRPDDRSAMSVPASVATVLPAGELAELEAPAGGTHREIADALTAAARSALRDVQDALERMRRGCYGRCVDCGGQIPVARLEVIPQVARCMACQREAGPR